MFLYWHTKCIGIAMSECLGISLCALLLLCYRVTLSQSLYAPAMVFCNAGTAPRKKNTMFFYATKGNLPKIFYQEYIIRSILLKLPRVFYQGYITKNIL